MSAYLTSTSAVIVQTTRDTAPMASSCEGGAVKTATKRLGLLSCDATATAFGQPRGRSRAQTVRLCRWGLDPRSGQAMQRWLPEGKTYTKDVPMSLQRYAQLLAFTASSMIYWLSNRTLSEPGLPIYDADALKRQSNERNPLSSLQNTVKRAFHCSKLCSRIS